MPTNLHLDDRLVEEARKLGGHRTKKDAVVAALRDYVIREDVKRKRRLNILGLMGTIDYDPSDWKAARRRKK